MNLQQSGVTIWLTGLSGSGKSTLAQTLRARFDKFGISSEILDGDEVRKALSPELGFTKTERDIHVRRLGYVANLLTRNGIVVIVAAISPYRETRDFNRHNIGSFVEVFCRCPLDKAEARDVKGLYRKVRRGEISPFTGIDDPYEEPLSPEVLVDTDKETVLQSTQKIWAILRKLGYLAEHADEFIRSSSAR